MLDVGSLRVLLVEDNELDARVLLRHLAADQQTKIESRHARSLGEAIQALDEEGFDCILLDLTLPDAAGLLSVETLMEHAPKSPVVVLTGLDDPTVAIEAVERGAQDYLTKQGTDIEQVGRALRYAVARHRSEAQLISAHEQLNVLHDRERIARDLHDNVIGQLFATGMSLQLITTQVDDPQLRAKMLEAVSGIDAGIHQLREAIFGLHATGGGRSVGTELRQIIESERQGLGFRPTLRVDPILDDPHGWSDPDARHDLAATVREALGNIAKHARATAAEVVVSVADDSVVLEISDNGVGLDHTGGGERDPLRGRGLINMATRARQRDGEFDVVPGPGGGTRLRWRVPFAPGP